MGNNMVIVLTKEPSLRSYFHLSCIMVKKYIIGRVNSHVLSSSFSFLFFFDPLGDSIRIKIHVIVKIRMILGVKDD